MRIATVSIMLATCLCAEASAADKVYVGKVSEVSNTSLVLEAPTGDWHIGFGAKNPALRALHKIKVGQEVRAVFGAMRDPEAGEINELLTIRECLPRERECARDRARMERESTAREKQSALSANALERCFDAMNVTLADDARYVPKTAPEKKDAFARSNALQGEELACAQNVFKQHTDAYLEACQRHHCGDNIGGGCYHFAGYALNAAVAEKAVALCRN
ncbi:MAG: hypothetical protein V4857_20105 [Pseudomonadota bacterium]